MADIEVDGRRLGSIKDFEAFARQTGHEPVESNKVEGEFLFLVKKA